jgi:hypothetical protein
MVIHWRVLDTSISAKQEPGSKKSDRIGAKLEPKWLLIDVYWIQELVVDSKFDDAAVYCIRTGIRVSAHFIQSPKNKNLTELRNQAERNGI